MQEYVLELPGVTALEALIDSDWEIYGGRTPRAEKPLTPQAGGFALGLAPYSGAYYLIREQPAG